MSSDGPANVLQKWAKERSLDQATLNPEGTQLTFQETTLPASEAVTVAHGDKSCKYTLASIYLQIINPDQGLKDYRQACKKHNVKDPVKAIDKGTVVGFFSPTSAAEPEAAPPTEAPKAPAPEAAPRPDKHRHEKERHKHRKDQKQHRHDKKRPHRHDSAEKKKKAPKTIDTAKLFSNLVTVVDKRSTTTKQQEGEKEKETAELVQALSSDGFDVTPELLSEYKEATQTIVANEIPVGNSASILKAAAGKDLSRILKLYMEVVDAKGKSSSKAAPTADRKSWRSHLVGKKPIIILPKGMTAPLTLLNAHQFFAHSKFAPRGFGASKSNIQTSFSRRVSPRLGGGLVEYELMDNPKVKLPTAKDWDRVVAVVCLGQAWQFKDWPGHYSNPVRLFGSVFGFYVGMEGEKLPADLQKWAVVQAKLNRDKRGLDSVTYASFWNGVDEFMAIHKPELLPQPET